MQLFKSAAHFSVCFDFMRYLRLENGNLIKKTPEVKIKSYCHADLTDIFGSKIVQVLFEKKAF
jgi:hypothetical protein